MDDDFDKLRSNDDEPEQPDDSLDWLKALEDNPPASSTKVVGKAPQDIPQPQADDPLAWLEEYVAPGEQEKPPAASMSSGVTGWLQNDDPFENTEGGQGEGDWMQSAGVFDTTNDQAAQPAPNDDVPAWLVETGQQPTASDTDMFSGLDEALGIASNEPQTPQPMDDAPDWLQEAAPAVPAVDDFFAQLNTPDDHDIPEAVPTVDDFFSQLNTPDDHDIPEAAPAVDDFFSQLNTPDDTDFAPLPDEDTDLLGQLKLTDTGSSDWFAEADQNAAASDQPDWLHSLGDLTPAEEEEMPPIAAADEPELATAEDDFLAELRAGAGAKGEFEEKSSPGDFGKFDAPGLQDIDSLLASYDNAPSVSQTDNTSMTDVDFDRLLSDSDVEQISARRSGEGRAPITGLSPDAPSWLTELGASVGSVDEQSAAAMVRKQTQNERPVDELTDRLFALHEAGMELPTPADTGSAEVIKSLLPGINEVISAAPLNIGLPGISTGDVALTNEQRDKINLLKTLVAVEEEKPRAPRPSAIDLTLDSHNLDDMAEPNLGIDEVAPEVKAASVVAQRGVRVKIDRVLISLVVVVAVVLPFLVSQTRIGNLPPAQFAAGSRQQAVYDRVNALQRGQMVLVAAEYGPTGAAELDSALDALLRHILMRGAHPVLVSGNAVGLLHAQNILETIAQDSTFLSGIKRPGRPLLANTDYTVARYLVGESIGLRDFGQNMGSLLATDVNGQPTNLTITSLHDFGLVVLVAERAEDVRAWGEQIAPLAGQPLVIATGYSAAPLAEPYVLSGAPGAVAGIGGMLVGYRDAYTYHDMLDVAMFGAKPVPPTITAPVIVIPTEANSEATQAVSAPGQTPNGQPATLAPTVQSQNVEGTPSESAATLAPTEAVATLQPTEAGATAAPTESRPVTITPTHPGPTEQPTSPGLVVQAVIQSDSAVNVREGPGTTFKPVASAKPGTGVQVIGRNGDGQWIQIRLSDGTEGWVSAQLIDIQEPTIEPSPTREGASRIDSNAVVALDSDVFLFAPVEQEATVEATSEVTPEATVAPAPPPTATLTAVVSVSASIPAYRDERWYSMTLGLMAIIVVIALAALVNIARGLFRRGK